MKQQTAFILALCTSVMFNVASFRIDLGGTDTGDPPPMVYAVHKSGDGKNRKQC